MNEEVDDARPEASFEFRVEKFSQLKDSVLSEATYVRNLPWKIMIMPRTTNNTKSVGYFLQCNGESEAASWSCQASAELRILKASHPSDAFSRKISHLFFAKENDWGFSHYMSWTDVMDPLKGYYDEANDVVTFQVKVSADAPHGVSWDSKKHTGYVGLKNQGATCYMNSLLQVLYFSNHLRKSVYKMPTEADDSSKSVALALQRVFNDLQFLDKAVGTKKLTKSFGWETLDSFMQHDVQEFLRVLLDKLEMKMKGTVVEGTIPKLFEGKMISYIKCKNVDYTSSRTESFYDIQLNIKGKKNIIESFRDYIKTETLEGENKYDAGGYGLQEAEKGILFESFPPILHLHLMRFHYDPLTDCSVKFNDRFEFPDVLNLTEFLKHKNQDEAMDVDNEDDVDDSMVYILHAVLVHSGDNHGGHYVVFINPKGDGKWCKFDDDVVSRCTSQEAIQYNFGGSDDDSNTRQSTNAYMLVYIRKSTLPEILCDVNDADIPEELSDRLEKEKRFEMARRKDKSEAHLYMNTRIITEDGFSGHQGNDLYDPDRAIYHELKIRKSDTLLVAIDTISEQFNQPKDRIRLWPMQHRANQTFRTCILDVASEGPKPLSDVTLNSNPWTVFLDIKNPEIPGPLKPFDKENDVLLFFKYYNPTEEKIYYSGHMHVSISATFSEIIPELLKRTNLKPDTTLILHEEVQPNMLEQIEDFDKPLETVLEDLLDGDIIVFQKYMTEEASQNLRLPTCIDYFRDLFNKVEVTFVDKNITNDSGFVLVLSQRMTYDSFSKAVADKLRVNSDLLQFFKSQSYRDVPNIALRCSFEGTLKDLLTFSKPKQPKKIFYQRLSIPVHELENKRQFKCYWLPSPSNSGSDDNSKNEEQELILYPAKTGTVKDLLYEAVNHLKIERVGKLRLVEIVSNKICNVASEDTLLEVISSFQNKTYRIEEIPEDQLEIGVNELLVPVAHFHKDIYSTFGTPFLMKICDGCNFEEIKNKIQKHLGVADKEFEKYRIAVIVVSRLRYVDENNFDDLVKIKNFSSGGQGGNSAKPWIGLEHVNKSSKRPRYNYMEKAIKIYN
ncbi:ubiquitin carboxyl-terminal hydrolase 7 [Lepeophtheirus salmonis]|uniref:ubiquitin carboxyl-terminal hydrolase 7 n=1 Tax=Lepeophtheirus salmonis TaxID=72036 RepID=UPI001AE3A001|nr:ubiquitin carboxyl-terminal hydrolase 7-like [Lepeophtheirus salmonis]